MKIVLLVKIIIIRVWRNFRGPIIEVNVDDMVDRMANKISQHELLVLFEAKSDEVAVDRYYQYNKKMYEIQNGSWVECFIGRFKNIPYWVTPWGGSFKKYSQKHLASAYSKEYVSKLKFIRSSIKKNKNNPEKYGYITGQLLIDKNGNRRFIIWNGHRRSLSLANLGYKKIKVEISGGDRWDGKIKNHIVEINKINEWENVKNGLYTKNEAIKFFNKFFYLVCFMLNLTSFSFFSCLNYQLVI